MKNKKRNHTLKKQQQLIVPAQFRLAMITTLLSCPSMGQGIHQLLLELTHRTTFAISIRLLIIFYYFGVGILKTKKN